MRAALDQPGERTTFSFPGQRQFAQRVVVQAAFFEHASVAQGQVAALQGTGDAAPGQRLAGADCWHIQALFLAGVEYGVG
ncbi:hypothetical protein D3C76_1357020 [compost metagenome]